METEAKIIKRHQKAHNELEKAFYIDGTLIKEEFDRLHGENWSALAHALIDAGFIDPPLPVRDLSKEIDDLKERVSALEPRLR